MDLTTTGHVPWWPEERNAPSLHLVLIHMITETQRHAGHATSSRELIDGHIGERADNSNLPLGDADWWVAFRSRVENAARQAGGR